MTTELTVIERRIGDEEERQGIRHGVRHGMRTDDKVVFTYK